MKPREKLTGLRLRLYEIIFEADTAAGRLFDLVLLACIVGSVITIMIESVQSIRALYGPWFRGLELFFTGIFTLEYLARAWVVPQRRRYVFSFFGIVDLLSILPSYLALLIPGAQSLMVIRSVRLIRIFRILKLSRHIGESQNLVRALKASQHKITVFLVTVLTTVVITGTLMYMIEGAEHGFTSIPRSIYWAIVTMTTVGYGDIAPQTTLGQTMASFIMILGYGILAVPTGIVSAEMVQLKQQEKISTQVCPHCLKDGHDADAVFCKFCGSSLNA
ncbi:ion transporter [Fulvivirgaceae bacterium PWU5]|uniref:Ion transporter n=1 Tax=Dawidia cretensis TaxID=2782350 RepID=A0AAP2DUK0_9BACT|nr:ion transporter [Dawidia cretensis]MBT1707511.1 ion transporter [Dawidia cretensis]